MAACVRSRTLFQSVNDSYLLSVVTMTLMPRRLSALAIIAFALFLPLSASAVFIQPNGPAVIVLSNATLTTGGSLQIVGVTSAEVDLAYSVTGTVSGGGTLTLFVSGTDPLNPANSVSGDASANSGGIVATNSSGVVVVSPLRSSSVKVSWTVSAGSFAGVNATLTIKSAIAQ